MKRWVRLGLFAGLLLVPLSLVSAQDGEQSGSPLFTLAGDAAVVSPGLSGEDWDIKWVNPGAIVYHAGQFHMFRNGFIGWPDFVSTGYTVSDDGVNWQAVGSSPVFTTDDVPYAGVLVMSSSVHVQDDGTWVMYFYNWDRKRAPMGGGGIGRATASDPEGPWTPDTDLVLMPGTEGAWDEGQVGVPTVLKLDASYVMYYSGFSKQADMRIGMATSVDGITWTKYDNPETTDELFAESDPVLDFDKADKSLWDNPGVERPRVVKTDDGWVMIYRTPGGGGHPTALGLATSADGIHWTKYPENPIITPASFPDRGQSLWFFNFLHENDTYYLYVEAITLANPGKSEIFLFTHAGSIFED